MIWMLQNTYMYISKYIFYSGGVDNDEDDEYMDVVEYI